MKSVPNYIGEVEMTLEDVKKQFGDVFSISIESANITIEWEKLVPRMKQLCRIFKDKEGFDMKSYVDSVPKLLYFVDEVDEENIQNSTFLEIENIFFSEEQRKEVIDYFNICESYELIEILHEFVENAEMRMIALRHMKPEKFLNFDKLELLDSQTITKTQNRVVFEDHDDVYDDVKLNTFQIKEVTFDDTYDLFKIKKEYFFVGDNFSFAQDVYFVRCKDTSTDRYYCLFTSPENGETHDVIYCMAEMLHMSKEEYIEQLKHES